MIRRKPQGEDLLSPLHQIEITKGNPTPHERDALIAAIVVVSIGAAAAAATYAVKKQPQLLTPWKLVGDGRTGSGFNDLKRLYAARRQQRDQT